MIDRNTIANSPVVVAVLQGVMLTLRICIGATFILAAMPKIMHPYVFLETVYRFELFNAAVGMWIAVLLPWLELSVGVSLIIGLWTSESLTVALLLSVGFVGVQWHSIHLGLSIECGCFGTSAGRGQLIGYATLLRALVVLLASGLGLFLNVRSARAPNKSTHRDGEHSVRPLTFLGKALT